MSSAKFCAVISARGNADESEMKIVPLSELRRQCSALLQLVKKTHEPIQVTRFGRPFVKIGPPGLSPDQRAPRDARDREILNRFADELNADALEDSKIRLPLVLREKVKTKLGKRRGAGNGSDRPLRLKNPKLATQDSQLSYSFSKNSHTEHEI